MVFGIFFFSTRYRLIKTEECLATMPEGTKYYNEKYKLLECASGYQLDNVNKLCITHCIILAQNVRIIRKILRIINAQNVKKDIIKMGLIATKL